MQTASREYNTVLGVSEAVLVEKKSRFIGRIAHAETEEQARAFLAEVAAANLTASHNVYCYILRETRTVRFSDAGEPSGTAGRPALEVLQKAEITDVCLVITRYFGGTLLGAGGLVRAYAKTASLALEAADPVRMEESTRFLCRATYADWARLQPALGAAGAEIAGVSFGSVVESTVLCRPVDREKIRTILADQSAGRAEIGGADAVLRPVKRKENGQ